MKHLKRFILMLQFMTTIPLRFDLKASAEDYGKGLVFAPVVGLFIGGVLAGLWYLLSFLIPPAAAAVIIMTAYILMTGGLHMDGLGDTFDGLFSGRPKERMLEIMRDSRVGTNAVLAIASVILLDTVLVYSQASLSIYAALLLFPVSGRIGSLISAGISRYARSGEGLGKSFIEFCGTNEILAGFVPYILIFFFAAGLKGLVLSIIPPAAAFISTRVFSVKIGGATGDILGAVCEINQTVFLIAVLVLSKFF